MMARTSGAPHLVEREDPLSFVLRNRPAREVLERLSGRPFMVPLTVRKSMMVHPETFRRVLADLEGFDLISKHPLTTPRPVHRPKAMSLRVDLGIKVTRRGENVLNVARIAREAVQRHARLLPRSSATHWLRHDDPATPRFGETSR